jgi:hypothetical protein
MIFKKVVLPFVEKMNNKVVGQLLLKLLTNKKKSETLFTCTFDLEKLKHPTEKDFNFFIIIFQINKKKHLNK